MLFNKRVVYHIGHETKYSEWILQILCLLDSKSTAIAFILKADRAIVSHENEFQLLTIFWV